MRCERNCDGEMRSQLDGRMLSVWREGSNETRDGSPGAGGALAKPLRYENERVKNLK